jgi:hypothetical protein
MSEKIKSIYYVRFLARRAFKRYIAEMESVTR